MSAGLISPAPTKPAGGAPAGEFDPQVSYPRTLTAVAFVVCTLVVYLINPAEVGAGTVVLLFQIPILFSAIALGRNAGLGAAVAGGAAAALTQFGRSSNAAAVAAGAGAFCLGWALCLAIDQVRRIRESRSILRRLQQAESGEPEAAIVVCEFGGGITGVNPAAEALTGRRREDFVGRPLDDALGVDRHRFGGGRTILEGGDEFEFSISPVVLPNGVVCGRTILLRRPESNADLQFDAERLSQAETRLGASEARYHGLAEMSPDAISIIQNGKVAFANRAALALFGAKSESEVVGRPVSAFIHPDDRAAGRQRMAAVLARGEVQPIRDMRFLRLDGRTVYAEACAGPCSFNGASAVQSVSRDVTGKRLEAAFLTRRNRVLELIATGRPLKAVLDEIVAMMEEQKPDYVCSILLVEGDRLRVASAPGLPQEYNAAIDGVKIGPSVGSCGTAAHRGETVFVADIQQDPLWQDFRSLAGRFGLRSCWSTPIVSRKRGDGPTVLGTFAVYARTTGVPEAHFLQKLERAEHLARIAIESEATLRELRRSEARFRAFVDHCADALTLHGPDGVVIDLNRQAEEALGYSRAEMIGRSPALFDPQVTQESLQDILDRLDEGESLSFDSVHRRKDGSVFPVEVRLRPFHAEGVRYCIALCHDITERKKVEAALRENEARLAEAQEIAGLGSYELDVQTWIGRASPVLCRLLRFADDSPLVDFNAFVSRYLHPDDREAAARNRKRLIEEGGSDVVEQRYVLDDGAVQTFQVRRRAVRDESGRTRAIVGTVQDVTERKRFEAELRRRNEELKLLSASAAALLAATDSVQAVADLFDRLSAHLGCDLILHFSADEGSLRLDAHQGAAPEDLELIAGASPEERPWSFCAPERGPVVADAAVIGQSPELGLLRRLRISAWCCHPLLAGDRVLGRLAFASRWRPHFTVDEVEFARTLSHYVATAKERLRIEAALRESEERGRLALDAAQLGTWRHDFEAGIIHLDERARTHHGVDRADVEPAELHRSIPEDDLQRVLAHLADEHQADRPGLYSFEHRILRKDGEVRWLAVSGRTCFTGEGAARRPAVAIGTTRDVTDHRRVETALRRSEETLRRAQEVAHVGSWVFDLATGALSASEEANRIHGWAPGPRKWEDLASIVHADDFVRFKKSWDGVVDGSPMDLEHRLVVQGQVRWVEVKAEAPANADGGVRQIIGVTQDVTARRKLEDQFRQSQKMEAIGRLAGGVAHDFNNLLTVINGYSDLVLSSLPSADCNRDAVAAIRDAGERAARLTQQLLSLSRKAIVEPRVLDLNALVSDSTKLLRRVVGEDIAFILTLEPELAWIKADPAQLEQALMNLVVNGRDAMPAGGRIVVETRNVTVGEADLPEFPDLRPGRYVQLSVSDTGCGIPDEVRANIFEPFFTTKAAGKGSGLGLAVVHGVVRQGGGHVAVSTKPGEGTTFRILLPVASEKEQRPRAQSGGEPGRGSETVLLVEDEDAVRSISRLALEMQGYKVLEASRGAEALKIVESHPGRIDLLVTDVVMPGIGGRQLADAFRERRPDSRVLYMSGYTGDAVVLHGVVEGRDALLRKPFTPLSLARKVRSTLDAGPAAAPAD